MAGDWIKLEHATLEKPEVALFAEFLGVSVNEGLGILLRFWFWLDRNSRNGVVTHTSRLSIEGIVRCVGFAAAIEAVGWAKFDDDKHEMRVPNFERHNGSPAKTRALGKDRASRLRNASSVTKPLPEKRREEKRTTKGFASQTLSGKPDPTPVNGKEAKGLELANDAREILAFLNAKAGKNFPETDSNVGIIVARLREGFTAVQVRQVVAFKVRKWRGDEKMAEFLRPETLFGRSKFSNYVGELVDVQPDQEGS